MLVVGGESWGEAQSGGPSCNKCVHPKLWLKGCFCVIKMHNKKAQNHEIRAEIN